MILKLLPLQVDVSGVARQYSEESKVSNLFCLVILEEQWKILPMKWCGGKTGHAESIQIEFDPKVISSEKILDILWHTHNPTTLNGQGNDVSTQYRSAIFFHNQHKRRMPSPMHKKAANDRWLLWK
jgi:hypothetical protein